MIKNVTIYTDKILGFNKGLRLVQVNDLHAFSSKDYKLLEKITLDIMKLRPHYLIINGDIIQNAQSYSSHLIYLLAKLSRVCRCLVVLGNHEYMVLKDGKWQPFPNTFAEKIDTIFSMHHLDSTSFLTHHLCFLGYELPFSWYEGPRDTKKVMDDLSTKLQVFTEETYNSLIIHDPFIVLEMLKHSEYEASLNNIDLVLAAHTHGFLVPPYLDKTDKGHYTPELSRRMKYYMRGKTTTKFFDLYTGYAIKPLPEEIPVSQTLNALYRPMMKILKPFYPATVNVIDIKNRQ